MYKLVIGGGGFAGVWAALNGLKKIQEEFWQKYHGNNHTPEFVHPDDEFIRPRQDRRLNFIKLPLS